MKKLTIIRKKIYGDEPWHQPTYKFQIIRVGTDETIGNPWFQTGCIAPEFMREKIAKENTRFILDEGA